MITIRTANPNDDKCLCALFRQLGYALTREEVGEKLNGVGSYGHLLVAESAGTLHGAIAFHFITPFHDAGQWCVISALVIDEATRGAGIGRQLLLETERYALEAGCSRIELACNEKRINAHYFYEKNGFREVRKRFIKRLSGAAG